MSDTIPARFRRQAQTLSDKPLFLVKRSGAYAPVSYRQGWDQAQAFAAFLIGQRASPGDRILILSENRPEWSLADIAIQSVGAWSVPLYPTLTSADVQAICANCQPVACVASTLDQAAKLLEAGKNLPSIRFIVVMDPPDAQRRDARLITWPEAVAQGKGNGASLKEVERRLEALKPEDPATIIYTSGTTGEPKGVVLSHNNFLSNVDACVQVIPINGSDTHLSFLPLSHVFERMAGWYLMWTVGASVAYAENLETVAQNMREVRPTIMLGVPRFFEKLSIKVQEAIQHSPPAKRRIAMWALGIGRAAAALTEAGEPLPWSLACRRAVADRLVFSTIRSHLGGRLRFFVSGSAPLSKEIAEFFFSLGIVILEGYGLTETSPVIAVNRLPVPVFGSVGPPIPGVEVRIAGDGEILTRGPHVMQGYYQNPAATAAMIVDGWLQTGDIGRLDAAGRLYVTDRKKDLIKTAGGKFVAPQKLETRFVTDPYISQAFVYGDRQPYCVALIVPKADELRRWAQEQGIAGNSLAELVHDPKVQAFYWTRVQALQQDLAPFEQVKRIALLEQEFSQAAGELTPTLKAKRSAIAAHHASALEGLYQTRAS